MAKTEGASWSDIEDRLKKHARRACSAAAGKVRDELFKEAKTVIELFYASYPGHGKEPLYYHRNYKNFRKKSFEKYYSDKGRDSVIYGGIRLTPQNLDPVYQDSTQEVFDTVFAGFHGPAGMFETPKSFHVIPPRMVPSPMQRLLDERDKKKKNKKKYISYGKKIAKRDVPITFK